MAIYLVCSGSTILRAFRLRSDAEAFACVARADGAKAVRIMALELE